MKRPGSGDPIDLAVAELEVRVRTCLGRVETAAFTLCSAERFGAFYDQFALRTGWGDPTTLARVRAAVWERVRRRCCDGEDDLTSALLRIEAATPHADDFSDTPEALFAQTACTALELAVRWCLPFERGPPELAVSPVIEALAALECLRETGCYDLGSGLAATRLREGVLDRGWVAAERSSQLTDLTTLSDGNMGWLKKTDVLLDRAVNARYVLVEPL